MPARRSLTSTVAASRIGGASNAANELPRIVPPGSASRSIGRAIAEVEEHARATMRETAAGTCNARR